MGREKEIDQVIKEIDRVISGQMIIDQMISETKTGKGLIDSSVARTVRITKESLFHLGQETEPYTEKAIDAMIVQEWGLKPRVHFPRKK